jgi:hypothetical protein
MRRGAVIDRRRRGRSRLVTAALARCEGNRAGRISGHDLNRRSDMFGGRERADSGRGVGCELFRAGAPMVVACGRAVCGTGGLARS